MNERIRRLLNEATSGIEPDLSKQRTVTLNEMEKFAELIVVECAMFVVTELEGKVGSAIADATANRLEKHFEVAND